MFVYSICVCVCPSSAQCVFWSTAGSVRPPPLPARCACANVSVCVWEREKQIDRTLLWAPCCHGGKPIMGHARVSGTPPTNLIQTHSFSLVYGCNCKALSHQLPPAIWRLGQVLLPQLDIKVHCCCPHIFSLVYQCWISVQTWHLIYRSDAKLPQNWAWKNILV